MRKGVVLVYVLWALTFSSVVFLSMMSVVYFYRVSLSRMHIKNLQVLEMFAVADGVLTEVRNRIPISEKPLYIAKRERTIAYEDRKYAVNIEPEDAKLSVNLYGKDTIEKLLILVGFEKKRAKEIVDGILIDRETKNIRFVSLSQLKGYMNEEEYKRIKPYISVVPTAVNINYAEPVVLEALGFRKEDVAFILRIREERGYLTVEDLNKLVHGKDATTQRMLSSRRLPEYYRITVETIGGSTHLRLSCILDKIGRAVDCSESL